MSVVVGEIGIFPFHFVPRGWLACDGTERSVSQEVADEALYHVLHPRFAVGDGGRYRLPDYEGLLPPYLRYCVAVHGIYPDADYSRRERCIGEVGTFFLRSDFQAGAWQRCTAGSAPAIPQADCLIAKTGERTLPQHQALAGAIGLVDVKLAGTEHPGWFPCDGRKMKVDSNESRILLSLIGAAFGGDWNEFALPKLPAPPGLAYYINAWGPYPERP